jgi:Uma2 family endonuclease
MYDVAARRAEPMTVEAFLEFCDTLPEGERWELIDGAPVMMTGGTAAHSLIPLSSATWSAALIQPHGDGAAAWISDTNAFEPDLVVRCGPIERRSRYATDPVIVVEVLSRSTMRRDRGLKFEPYRQLPSVEQIVFVYQDSVRVESWLREQSEWLAEPVLLLRSEDKLTFPALGVSLAVTEIYESVTPSPLNDL